jgi:putative addiction module antidote
MTTVKLRKVGNSLGFLVPREVSEHLRAKEGDTFHVVAEPGGAVRITPYDPTFEQAMSAFQRTRHKFRNALRALAQ